MGISNRRGIDLLPRLNPRSSMRTVVAIGTACLALFLVLVPVWFPFVWLAHSDFEGMVVFLGGTLLMSLMVGLWATMSGRRPK